MGQEEESVREFPYLAEALDRARSMFGTKTGAQTCMNNMAQVIVEILVRVFNREK